GIRGGVHVDDRHTTQLGRILRHQRFLPSFYKAHSERKTLRYRFSNRDGAADDRIADRYVLYGLDWRSMETVAGHWRGNGHSTPAALVLVAHQRVVRSIRDDHRCNRFDLPAKRFEVGQRQSERLRVYHAGDGWNH